jgi:HEAT repeat protein
MRIHIPRLATLLLASSAACLTAVPVLAQTAPRPLPPERPSPPIAPVTPVTPITPDAQVWMDAELSSDAAMAAARSAIERVRGVDLALALDEADINIRQMVAPIAIPSFDFDFDFGSLLAPRARVRTALRDTPPAPWAKADPADSLYRLAREALNAGEYRRAAELFAQIDRQYPNSQYHADAAYWRAFALYRIGGIADLHEALQTLDSSPTADALAIAREAARGAGRDSSVRSWPSVRVAFSSRSRSSDSEAAVLAMRIRGALAARGDATAAAQIARTADGSATSCDDEDAQLRVEALNALVQMDPKSADPAIAKVLARRDSCSASLRQGAIALVARANDVHSTDLLIATARNDPSIEVQAEAIRWLGRASDARATTALISIATSSNKAPLQRIAVRALAAQQSPTSSQALRSLVTRTDVPADVRITALHYAGKSDLQIADLARMYDASADRATRDEIVSLLEQRDEPQAADKLIDIVRTSTDPSMRRRAISALSHKKDPRTAKLLMDIVDK